MEAIKGLEDTKGVGDTGGLEGTIGMKDTKGLDIFKEMGVGWLVGWCRGSMAAGIRQECSRVLIRRCLALLPWNPYTNQPSKPGNPMWNQGCSMFSMPFWRTP